MTTFLFFLPFLIVFALLAVWAERKLSAFIQDRMGPMEVGRYGLLQTAADIIKLLLKEDIVPTAADRRLFLLAPVLLFTAILTAFAVLPLTSTLGGAELEIGVFFLLAIVSLDVLGILMAGWGSNSKFSLYGAMRSVSQLVSYEIPLGLSVLCVVVFCQSMDLQAISFQQSAVPIAQDPDQVQWLFSLPGLGIDISAVGGILTWNIFRMPLFLLVFVIFFIASLAEANRAPFDLPESESELIGGYHTEYSGFRWAVFMLSEYGVMLLVSVLGVVLFLGSWNSPLPNVGSVELYTWTTGTPGSWSGQLWGAFWIISKAMALIYLQMWVRWTYPRLRVDQLLVFCWKYLIPASLILLFLTAWWRLHWVSYGL
ncbi:MAG TPA: NADH-quinone oxidoreductase subunit H [Cytophagales bacterium]|nr:NADH-quinone oxidoreductase subunit H [Cytophagales bacterium]HAA23543.1 NADH-quinone oxidoreductase subunit H [Cytophagales bacterium]HAP59553.1 NADH-quinone oxidoreductase subunit H [Cytophagales bacterium]